MVMTAHILNKRLDPEYPATLSDYYIRDLLRKKLGFKGVVVSDDMQMGAIAARCDLKTAIVRAVNAGCDLVLISNNASVYDERMPYEVRDIISRAVKSGEIPVTRILEASRRIRELKNQPRPGNRRISEGF